MSRATPTLAAVTGTVRVRYLESPCDVFLTFLDVGHHTDVSILRSEPRSIIKVGHTIPILVFKQIYASFSIMLPCLGMLLNLSLFSGRCSYHDDISFGKYG